MYEIRKKEVNAKKIEQTDMLSYLDFRVVRGNK